MLWFLVRETRERSDLMAKLKDYFKADLDIFISSDEFATTHEINGVEMKIVLDDDMLDKRKQVKTDYAEGIYEASLLYYVKKSVYGTRPVEGEIQNFDGNIYRIAKVHEEEDLYSIALMGNEA